MFTLGHGTAAKEELAKLLRDAQVASVVDVRKIPKSRRHPQFWAEAMETWIPELANAAYRWEPAFGGFRKPDPRSPNIALRNPAFRAYADYLSSAGFKAAFERLLARAAGEQLAILCSETLWWRCHRRLIADAAVLLHGVGVEHLMHDGKKRPHVPTEGVRVTAEGDLRYDVLEPEGF